MAASSTLKDITARVTEGELAAVSDLRPSLSPTVMKEGVFNCSDHLECLGFCRRGLFREFIADYLLFIQEIASSLFVHGLGRPVSLSGSFISSCMHLKDGGSMFYRNIGIVFHYYMESEAEIKNTKIIDESLWKPEILRLSTLTSRRIFFQCLLCLPLLFSVQVYNSILYFHLLSPIVLYARSSLPVGVRGSVVG
jgi:hypothetical protein